MKQQNLIEDLVDLKIDFHPNAPLMDDATFAKIIKEESEEWCRQLEIDKLRNINLTAEEQEIISEFAEDLGLTLDVLHIFEKIISTMTIREVTETLIEVIIDLLNHNQQQQLRQLVIPMQPLDGQNLTPNIVVSRLHQQYQSPNYAANYLTHNYNYQQQLNTNTINQDQNQDVSSPYNRICPTPSYSGGCATYNDLNEVISAPQPTADIRDILNYENFFIENAPVDLPATIPDPMERELFFNNIKKPRQERSDFTSNSNINLQPTFVSKSSCESNTKLMCFV